MDSVIHNVYVPAIQLWAFHIASLFQAERTEYTL